MQQHPFYLLCQYYLSTATKARSRLWNESLAQEEPVKQVQKPQAAPQLPKERSRKPECTYFSC